MKLFLRLTTASLGITLASIWMPLGASAQEAPHCISPEEAAQKSGAAPGMKVQLISEGPRGSSNSPF